MVRAQRLAVLGLASGRTREVLVAEDIFSQVDADMQAQRVRALARRFGAAAVAGLVVIGAGVGFWQYNVHERHLADQAASARYFHAVHDIGAAGALTQPLPAGVKAAEATLADLLARGPVAMRGYAGLELGTVRQQSGDVDGAQHAWTAVAGDQGIAPSQRAVAKLSAVNALIDRADPKVSRVALQELTQSNGPWRALAQEQLAGLDLRPGGSAADIAEARRLLLGLTQNPDAPGGVRERAQAVLQTFGGAG